MSQFTQVRLRRDLLIVKNAIARNRKPSYLIQLPESQNFIELGEEEYYLCQLMIFNLTQQEICERFMAKFGSVLTARYFNKFTQYLNDLGLIESDENQKSPEISELNISQLDANKVIYQQKYINRPYHWRLFNPYFMLSIMGDLGYPFRQLIYALFPLLGIAILTIINNRQIFFQDIKTTIIPISVLSKLGINLLTINFMGKLAAGIVYTHYGGIISVAGIQFIFGFLPLFYLQMPNLWQFRRQQLLWIFAAPLLFRLLIFSVTILLWFCLRTTQPKLSTFSLILSQISLLSFAIQGNPCWKSNGYFWLSTYLRMPKLLEQARFVTNMRLKGRLIPFSLSGYQTFALQIYAVIMILSWGLLLLAIALGAKILIHNYRGIGALILIFIISCTVRWYLRMNKKTHIENTDSVTPARIVPDLSPSVQLPRGALALKKKNRSFNFLKTTLKIGFVIGAGFILSLPYRYRPGGAVELLTHKQQEIQADISGRITNVYVDGGDGKWIEAGTVIAEIEPSSQLHRETPTENDLLIKQEQINLQKAEIEKAKANLNRLLSTPRPEAVNIARQQLEVEQQQLKAVQSRLAVAQEDLQLTKQALEVETEQLAAVQSRLEMAQEDVKVAEQSLETAQVRLDFRTREANRWQELYQEGAVSLQDFEDADRLAKVAEAEVEEQKSNIQSKLKQIKEREHEVQVQRYQIEQQKQNIVLKQKQVEEHQDNVQTQQKNIAVQQANLEFVMSGPHPEEIVSARQDLEAAKAQLKQLDQDTQYTKIQLERRTLITPFDGRITTSNLTQKVGSYLDQGQVFVKIEDDRTIRGEIDIPESDLGEFEVGTPVEIKLLAYPNQIILGKVIVIEPTITESERGRFIKTIVEIPNDEGVFKPGMTGYAKIEGEVKPLIFSFTRPLTRFFQIEMWSWIP
ncbi:MAG: HlyD family efflux transporter periplasmic adaptor subunit [Microcoleaceae cyanobacterium]